MKRRHFLATGAAGVGLASCRNDPEETLWKGIAMGTEVSVKYHGKPSFKNALAAVKNAEEVLTLWSGDSSLSRLNESGSLENPPDVLLDCLQKSRELHEATGGIFDPTIHSFLEWAKFEYEVGRTPKEAEVGERLKRVNFDLVEFSKTKISLLPGMSLSFNAIAQGYLTDVFVENFSTTSALVNFGEYRVVGDHSWPVEVKGRTHKLARALAVSSGSGQRLSATSAVNHLIHPKTGKSPPPKKVVAVEAAEAWLADGLSTVVAIGGGIPGRYSSARVL